MDENTSETARGVSCISLCICLITLAHYIRMLYISWIAHCEGITRYAVSRQDSAMHQSMTAGRTGMQMGIIVYA